MAFLLYHPRTRPSGRAVAAALGIRAGIRGTRIDGPLIRWGSQRQTVADEPPLVLNTVPALARAADKLEAFQAMASAGISVPKFGTDPADLEGPVIGRTRHGCAGEGIVLYSEDEWQNMGTHELYVEFIESVREYRVHVVGDEVIRAQYKVDESGEQYPIRNFKNGYRFRGLRSMRLNSDRIEAAVAAVKALGLDFGAVDLLIDHDDRPVVLEVNTAPACSPLTVTAYAQALGGLIGN